MILLTKIDPEQNMARFYALDVQPTLFGEYVLLKEWGRIGSGGQQRRFYFASEDEATKRAIMNSNVASAGGMLRGIPAQ